MVYVKREQILLKRRINFNVLKYVFVISVKIFNSKSIQRMIRIEKLFLCLLLLTNHWMKILSIPRNRNEKIHLQIIELIISFPQFYRILHFYAHTFSLLLHLLTNFLSTI